MHLTSLTIRNFRAIHDISIDFDSLVNVIVGPNAIGKTTILEAIRLAKGLLAPRTASEANQVMISLGIASPHIPQTLSFESIFRDKTRPVEISCRYKLSVDQVTRVSTLIPHLASSLVQAQLGQTFGNPVAVIQFLSSPDGQTALRNAETAFAQHVTQLQTQPYCNLNLAIDAQGNARGLDQFAQLIGATLDRELPPSSTLFSYFPADRALPAGEPVVQLGAADSAQQLESYNSQPQTKYTRLKSTIFNIIATDENGRNRLHQAFERIFDAVLKGRRLSSVGITSRGTLAIRVADTATGQTFDIDSMSSGEKGLILTFLLMSQSIANDGLVLLDEPELHLNPAVCKDVLSFLVSEYAIPQNVQAIVCTHSPEILAGALDSEDCSLYHLRSESAITKVRISDGNEVASTLQRLGSSQSEVLLYRGTAFVEGPDDVALLETGFENFFSRYKLKDLGGRREVEKEITRLQESEARGADFPLTMFFFDLDRQPLSLANSERVKIVQWRRRTIENYLLDPDTLTDLLTDADFVISPLQNMGEVLTLLRRLADDQLTDTVARDVYEARSYTNPGFRKGELQGKPIAEAADVLFSRLATMQSELLPLSEISWKKEFIEEVQQKLNVLQTTWSTHWIDLCDGKRLFKDLQREVPLRISVQRFKRQAMLRLRVQQRDSWTLMSALIQNAIGESAS